MANQTKRVLGQAVLVKIDMTSPDGTSFANSLVANAFTVSTLINTTTGIKTNSDTSTDNLIDLDNRGKPASKVSLVTATEVEVDGAGLVHAPDVSKYQRWALEGQPKNVILQVGNGVGSYALVGPSSLVNFGIDTENQKGATCSISLKQADAFLQVDYGNSIVNAVANAAWLN